MLRRPSRRAQPPGDSIQQSEPDPTSVPSEGNSAPSGDSTKPGERDANATPAAPRDPFVPEALYRSGRHTVSRPRIAWILAALATVAAIWAATQLRARDSSYPLIPVATGVLPTVAPSTAPTSTSPSTVPPQTTSPSTPPTTPPPTDPPSTLPSEQADLVAEATAAINAARTGSGLPVLTVDPAIARAAQGHSEDMARAGTLQHTGTDGSDAGARLTSEGYSWITWGEAVGAGQPSGKDIVGAWLDSPPHAQIVLGEFVDVGVGLAVADNGVEYWTVVAAVDTQPTEHSTL
jgi:uncharacterized protein YkwD